MGTRRRRRARRQPLRLDVLLAWAEHRARSQGVPASTAAGLVGDLLQRFGGRRIPALSARLRRDMEIVAELDAGRTADAVARRFGVSIRTVQRIGKRPSVHGVAEQPFCDILKPQDVVTPFR